MPLRDRCDDLEDRCTGSTMRTCGLGWNVNEDLAGMSIRTWLDVDEDLAYYNTPAHYNTRAYGVL